MVAMVDRPHPSQPGTCLVHPTTLTNTKPLLKNTSAVKCLPRQRSTFLSRSPRFFFSGQKGEIETLPPPALLRSPHTNTNRRAASLRLPSCVLPSSCVMSNQIIQSFRNRLLFTTSAFGELSYSPKKTGWLTCCVDTAHVRNMLTSPEGSLTSESASVCCQQRNSMQQGHQRNSTSLDSFQECDLTSAVNLIKENEVTQVHIEQETGEPKSSELLHDNEDFDQSDSDPIQTEYDSETEELCDDEDDDCVEFCDDLAPLTKDVRSPNSVKLMSIVSSESGYFENGCGQPDSGEESDDVCWSDDSEDEGEFCSEVWASFESQALSPMVVCRRSETVKTEHLTSSDCNSSRAQTPLSPPTVEAADTQPAACIRFQTPKKQVRFKPDDELVEVHTIIAWNYAYRAARKGPWEQYARDRCHFRRRIDSVSSVLEPCLSDKLSRMSSVRA